MATQASLDQIQQLYIAYYGRPADSGGLNYWATTLDANNGNLSRIVDAFANSAESTALYGANSSAESLVTAIYQNVLHRAPEAGGLEFYAKALASGQISAGNLALAVLNGVQNVDVATVQNELAVANEFTAQAADYGGDTAAAIGRTFLLQVSSDSAANDTLLSHVTSYINAASAATSNPSQFDGKISGGVLTDTTVVDQYASGTTPSTGGDTGGSTGGDTGGSTGGDTGGSTGGDTGGSTGGDTGGDTGGSTGGDTGGSTGGDTGGSTGGDTGFNMSVDSSSHLISFSNPSGTVTITSITPGTTNTGDRTITATSGGVTTSVTVQGDASHHVVLEGFAVSSAQSITISDQLVNDWNVSGAGNVHVTSSNVAGTYDLTSIAVTGALTIDPDTSATFVLTVAQADNANLGMSQHYEIADTLAHLEGAAAGVVSRADSYSLTDTSTDLGALSVTNADLVHLASNHASYTYAVSDTASALYNALNASDATLNGAALTANDATAAVLSVVQADALVSHDVTFTNGYAVSDTAAHLADALIANDAALSGAEVNLSASDTSAATLSVVQADALHTANVTVTPGYTVNDTAAHLADALIANDAALSGAEVNLSASDTSAATLSVDQVDALHAAQVQVAAGYMVIAASTSLADYDAAVTAIGSDADATVAFASGTTAVPMSAADYGHPAYVSALQNAGYSINIELTQNYTDPGTTLNEGNVTLTLGESVTAVDLSASIPTTHGFTIDASATGSSSIVGSSEDDIITAGSGANVISGGVGADTINLAATHDTQTLVFDAGLDSTPSRYDVVTNFTATATGDALQFHRGDVPDDIAIIAPGPFSGLVLAQGSLTTSVDSNGILSFAKSSDSTSVAISATTTDLSDGHNTISVADVLSFLDSAQIPGKAVAFTNGTNSYVVESSANNFMNAVELVGVQVKGIAATGDTIHVLGA
ncbi:DUF4214 domain-containing protein [Paraburkholderia phymatum]|uniref:DUF4214 domain-containing protein n=1 Tax=Paraburkholderia phymatum TaxID=148447 RepID=UPI0031729EF6